MICNDVPSVLDVEALRYGVKEWKHQGVNLPTRERLDVHGRLSLTNTSWLMVITIHKILDLHLHT